MQVHRRMILNIFVLMKQFLLRLLLFLSPFIFASILYAVIDPFKVIYSYPEYINTDKNYQVTLNRDFQSTELFLSNCKKYHYDSFIFGNSRSFFYHTTTWKKYIRGDAYHFNASNEGIYGINGKLKLIERKKVTIKNALIILDGSSLTKIKNSSGHLFIKHPEVSNESWFNFHKEMASAFFTPAIIAYTDLFVTGKYKPYMKSFGIRNKVWKHDVITNQLSYDLYDKQIAQDPKAYYTDKMEVFSKRNNIETTAYERLNVEERRQILRNIHTILKLHHTNYKIIISPLYDEEKLNPLDLRYLQYLFGTSNVFDFSGKNSFTEPYTNYYEKSHYRPVVCDRIMAIVYGDAKCGPK